MVSSMVFSIENKIIILENHLHSFIVAIFHQPPFAGNVLTEPTTLAHPPTFVL